MKKLILVTGLCGAGKTHYANSLGLSVRHYDSLHNYKTGKTNYGQLMKWAGCDNNEIVLDAWDIYNDPELTLLQNMVGNRQIEVRYVYSTPLEIHLAQLRKHTKGLELTHEQKLFVNNTEKISGWMQQFTDSSLGAYATYLFRLGGVVSAENKNHCEDTMSSDATEELLEWVDKTSNDSKYQTIDIQGSVIRDGYSKSKETWDIINSWCVKFHGDTVADLACFNGYFSIQVARKQNYDDKVDSYDNSETAIKVAEKMVLLNLAANHINIIKQDLSKQSLSKNYDLVLLLNCLHHITSKCEDNGKQFLLDTLFMCRRILVTVEPNQLDLLQWVTNTMGFKPRELANIHPEGRQLFYYQRKL